jgi:hypothetical protein
LGAALPLFAFQCFFDDVFNVASTEWRFDNHWSLNNQHSLPRQFQKARPQHPTRW